MSETQSLITTEDQYYKVLSNIDKLDKWIGKAYSYIEKINEENEIEIIRTQALIDTYKKKRLANFNLAKMYEAYTKREGSKSNIYIVTIGDTLVHISSLMYGDFNYWQYLYYYNDLDTDELTPGQELIIPELQAPIDPFINGAAMFAAEYSKLYAEKVLGEYE